jgi:hypothetical protein
MRESRDAEEGATQRSLARKVHNSRPLIEKLRYHSLIYKSSLHSLLQDYVTIARDLNLVKDTSDNYKHGMMKGCAHDHGLCE